MVNISEVINNQYPHFLYRRTSGEAIQDDNGSWSTPSEAAYSLCGRCREETAGRGAKVQAANGIFREFSSLVQMPTGIERIPEGTEIVVTTEEVSPEDLLSVDFVRQAAESGKVRLAGEVLKFDVGRLHNRAWI